MNTELKPVSRGQSPDEAAGDVLALLTARGPAALDPARPGERARAVAATIEASLVLLDRDDQRRYLDLAIFPEDVDIPLDVLAVLWQDCQTSTGVHGTISCTTLEVAVAVTASEARKRLFPLIEQVNADQEPVEILSKRGTAYLVSEAQFRSMQETAYLLRSPANAAHLAASIAEAEAGAAEEHDLLGG